MNLDEKINLLLYQHVIFRERRDEEEPIREEDIEGLFGPEEFRMNARELQEPIKLLQKINDAIKRYGPVMINVNYEGGNFVHINHPQLTEIISAMALATIDDENLTRQVATIIGRELRAMGVSWNFAPLAELIQNPYFPSSGIRSFGDSPEKVAKHVKSFILGMQAQGVAATAKHFPGVGFTTYCFEDLYPLVTSEIGERELAPFRAAVDADVAFILPKHGVYTSIDPKEISTFSKRFVTGFLREKLGYDGIIVSDSMCMGCVTRLMKQKGIGNMAVKALQAGVDMLLLESTISYGSTNPSIMERIQKNYVTAYLDVHNAVKKALLRGEINIDGKVEKILELEKKYAVRETVDYCELRKIMGTESSRRLLQMAAKRAVNIVYNNGILPLDPASKTLFIRTDPKKSNRADSIVDMGVLESELSSYAKNLDVLVISTNEDLRKLSSKKGNYEHIIVESYFGYTNYNNLDIQSDILKEVSTLWPQKAVYVIKGIPLELSSELQPGAIVLSSDVRKITLEAIAESIYKAKETKLNSLPVSLSKISGMLHHSLASRTKPVDEVKVIIATTGGRWLEQTIDYVYREFSLLDGFEGNLILGLNSSRAGSEDIVRLLKQKYGFVVEECPIGKFNTVSNIVKKYKESMDFIVLMDDDIIPVKGSLQNILEEVKRSPGASYLVGAMPIPVIETKGSNLLQRFWREVFAMNRRDDLAYFPLPRLPCWAQFVAMHKDQFPNFAENDFPITTNDSFLYLATFFPNVKMITKACYYFLPNDSFREYAERKARIHTGVIDVVDRIEIPLLGQLNHYLDEERRIQLKSLAKPNLKGILEFLTYSMINKLVQKRVTRNWLTPLSTKNRNFDYEALYNSTPRFRNIIPTNFYDLVSEEVAVPKKEAIYLME